jgi:hypothetical protein
VITNGLWIVDAEVKMVIGTSDGVWQQRVSAYDNGDGRRWLFVFDGGDGRLLWHQWTIVVTMLDDVGDGLRQGNGEAKMAGTVASVDNRYGVQWQQCSMALAMDYGKAMARQRWPAQ